MSYSRRDGEVRINMGEVSFADTSSLSETSNLSLLSGNPNRTKVILENLKANKKNVAGLLAVVALVAFSATYVGMQHQSTEVYRPSDPLIHNTVVLESKPVDEAFKPFAMALKLKDGYKEIGSPEVNRETKVPYTTTTTSTERNPRRHESNSNSKNEPLIQPKPTLEVSPIKKDPQVQPESEPVEDTGNQTVESGDDGNASAKLKMEEHLSKLEIAAPPKLPKRQKFVEIPVNASSMHPKSVINNLHLMNQTYWRYDCMDGSSVLGFKSVLTFVYNGTIHEFEGFGIKLKEAETVAAHNALHDLWKVDYKLPLPTTLSEKDRKLCPKTPTIGDISTEDTSLALTELYEKHKNKAIVQGPKRKTVKELPKDPMKLDPKSLVYQMDLESFKSHKIPCRDGRSPIGFKCILTFVDNSGTPRQFEGYGKKWKDAEKEAARAVAQSLWNLNFDPRHTMTEEDRKFCPKTPTL